MARKNKEPLCVLDNVLWVPRDCVDDQTEDFTYRYETITYQPQIDLPSQCANCDLWGKTWRPGKKSCADLGYGLLDTCKHFTHKKHPVVEEHVIKTWKNVGEDWTVFGRGDLGKIERLFGHLGIRDQRASPRLKFELKSTTTPYDYQQKVLNRWLDHGYGIFQAPTAYGKTVCWAWLVSHLGLKTLLLAQETRHLNVAYEGIYEHTNIAQLETELEQKLVGRINKKYRIKGEDPETGLLVWEEHKTTTHGVYYPITVSTFQSLASKRGRKLCKKLKNEFGLVWLEESHHEAASTFHKVTRTFNPFYRGGQTATPTRKDQKHVAIYDTIGPVTARGKKEAMTPKVFFHNSNILVPDSCFKGRYAMVQVINYLARNKVYQDLLFEKVLEEIEEGRRVLVITERVKQGLKLMDKLKTYGANVDMVKGGQKMRPQDDYSKELIDGRLNCIIGTKVINENVNIPPLDSLHLPFPCFTKETEEQRVGRVRRYLSGSNKAYIEEKGIDWEKPQPRVHVYTWHSSNTMSGAAIGFREKLYRKMGFDFDISAEHIQSSRKKKTMRSLLGDDDDD